ncbi:Myb-like_DNA-binding domain-containing protein [Hexamita inflata]|uniref:Myb-like DNA-binding domain-containing protein n=1 Tax=Hexamita inflata TaxID=28002 RepID=A0AA86QZU8_9EUKA|nr:Myb-like DNA-binding domain-containing protein [Hexamita inflata]
MSETQLLVQQNIHLLLLRCWTSFSISQYYQSVFLGSAQKASAFRTHFIAFPFSKNSISGGLFQVIRIQYGFHIEWCSLQYCRQNVQDKDYQLIEYYLYRYPYSKTLIINSSTTNNIQEFLKLQLDKHMYIISTYLRVSINITTKLIELTNTIMIHWTDEEKQQLLQAVSQNKLNNRIQWKIVQNILNNKSYNQCRTMYSVKPDYIAIQLRHSITVNCYNVLELSSQCLQLVQQLMILILIRFIQLDIVGALSFGSGNTFPVELEKYMESDEMETEPIDMIESKLYRRIQMKMDFDKIKLQIMQMQANSHQ